jgi:hypothetical protein
MHVIYENHMGEIAMSQAKLFIVDQPYQEKNAQIITGGKLVKNEWEAELKVCIVQQEYQADIKIMRKNFPS